MVGLFRHAAGTSPDRRLDIGDAGDPADQPGEDAVARQNAHG